MNEKLFRLYLTWLEVKNTFIYAFYERPRGLDFARSARPYPSYSDNVRYERTPFKITKRVMAGTLDADAHILDAGCGKGFFICSLKKLGYKNVDGLEYDAGLFACAKRNFSRLGTADVQLFNADASTFNELDSYDAVYIFNPFQAVVMLSFLKKIEASLVRRPRNFTVIYLNPVEFRLWDASPMFELAQVRTVRSFPHRLDAHYYMHKPGGFGSPRFSETLRAKMSMPQGKR